MINKPLGNPPASIKDLNGKDKRVSQGNIFSHRQINQVAKFSLLSLDYTNLAQQESIWNVGRFHEIIKQLPGNPSWNLLLYTGHLDFQTVKWLLKNSWNYF